MRHIGIIGRRGDGSPIQLLTGAAEPGGMDFFVTPDDVDEDRPDTEGDDAPDDAWTPPTREEWQRLQHKATGATREATRRRGALRSAGLTRSGKPRDSDQGDTEGSDGEGSDSEDQGTAGLPDRELARIEARALVAAEERVKPLLVRTALVEALSDAGWSGQDRKLVERLLDLGEVRAELGDDGEPVVTGLAEQIKGIKDEFPMWFRGAAPTPRGAAAVDGGSRRSAPRRVTAGTWQSQLGERMGRGR